MSWARLQINKILNDINRAKLRAAWNIKCKGGAASSQDCAAKAAVDYLSTEFDVDAAVKYAVLIGTRHHESMQKMRLQNGNNSNK